MHQSIPAAPNPPPLGQLRGICAHCQSRGTGISLIQGYPRSFDTHAVQSDSKSKRGRFYRKRPVICHRLACPSRIGQNCGGLSRRSCISLLQGYPQAFDTHAVQSDSKSKRGKWPENHVQCVHILLFVFAVNVMVNLPLEMLHITSLHMLMIYCTRKTHTKYGLVRFSPFQTIISLNIVRVFILDS